MVRLDLLLIPRRKTKCKRRKTNFIYVHHEPNSLFPHGIPNPLLERNRSSTVDVVVRVNADFGVHSMVTLTAAFYLIKMVSLFLENMYRVFSLRFFYKKKRVPPLFMTPVSFGILGI